MTVICICITLNPTFAHVILKRKCDNDYFNLRRPFLVRQRRYFCTNSWKVCQIRVGVWVFVVHYWSIQRDANIGKCLILTLIGSGFNHNLNTWLPKLIDSSIIKFVWLFYSFRRIWTTKKILIPNYYVLPTSYNTLQCKHWYIHFAP